MSQPTPGVRWDNFYWVWVEGEWRIDLQESGGSPLPCDPAPQQPPFTLDDLKVGEEILARCWWKPEAHPNEERPTFHGLDVEIALAVHAAKKGKHASP